MESDSLIAGSLRKQGMGVSSIVQQNQEFSIQNEDFPALPGYKGVSDTLLLGRSFDRFPPISCQLQFSRLLYTLGFPL